MNNGVNNNTNTQPQQPVNGVPVQNTNVVPAQQVPVSQQPVTQQTTVPQATATQQPVAQQPVTATTNPVPEDSNKTIGGYNIVPPSDNGIDASAALKARKAQEEKDKEEAAKKAEEEKKLEEERKAQEALAVAQQPVKKKRGGGFIFILLLIIAGLSAYIVYSSKDHKTQIDNLTYNCTPILASKEETKLDVNSTLVQGLYSKVVTNIREDIAQPYFNDNMKLYLAYRQVLESDKYETNCNLFSGTSMEPFVCDVNSNFVPKAFKKDKLILAYKLLFGENTPLELSNVQLGHSCIGGYQYIEARDEYVQGYCNQQNSTSFKVTKELVEATSTRNTIILKEDVKYHISEGMELPEYLKSGYYYYVFRLDLNYNYVLVSKTYQSKY